MLRASVPISSTVMVGASFEYRESVESWLAAWAVWAASASVNGCISSRSDGMPVSREMRLAAN